MRVIDLSLSVNPDLPGADIAPAKRLDIDGWNATTLTLYSHCGTHMDAPCHFLPDGRTLDQQDLSVCVGPARIVNMAPAEPRQLLQVADLGSAVDSIQPGDRLLLRTDWHKRYGTPAYRHELPRISDELANWLVEKQVGLVGVEPPSVADVNDKDEVTRIHHILFRGDVLIVEGLCHLDQITQEIVQFIALPMKITNGDGSPVRAIAIESAESNG